MKTLFIIYIVYAIITGIILFYDQKSQPTDSIELKWHYKKPKEYLVLVEDRSEAFLTRLNLINQAEESIDICYYSMHDTNSTDLILAGLIEASQRGVKVRIILDGFLHWINPKMVRLVPYFLNNENISYRIYEPFNILKPWTWNNRQHEKMFIVDKKYSIIGGRNIADKYYSSDEEAPVVNDRDVMVVSPDKNGFSNILLNHYNNLWSHEYTKNPKISLVTLSHSLSLKDKLLDKLNYYRKNYPDNFTPKTNYQDQKLDFIRISYINNPYQRWNKDPYILQKCLELMEEAEESVLIQTPYLIPNKPMLKMSSKYDIDTDLVSIYTNSLTASPNLTAWSAYRPMRKNWVEGGSKIFEYTNQQQSQHAKMFMVDKKQVVMGSFNTDPRSAYLNTELMLVIDSPDLAELINKENFTGPNNHYQQITDGDKLEASPSKKISLEIIRFLTAPVRHLL